MTKSNFNSSLVISVIIIMVVLTVCVCCLALQQSSNSGKRSNKSKTITVANDSINPVTIEIKDRHVTIPPEENVKMAIAKNTQIRCDKASFIVKNPSIKQLIISEDGIDSDLNATSNTRVENISNTDVVLTYEDKSRKLHSIMVGKGLVIKGPVIRKGQRWKVYDKNGRWLANELEVMDIPKRKVIWDGNMLK